MDDLHQNQRRACIILDGQILSEHETTKEITKAEDIMNLNFSEEEVDKELDKYTDWEQLEMYNLQQ